MKSLSGSSFHYAGACCVLLLVSLVLPAQNDGPVVLGLNDCIRMGIQNSYQLQSDSLLKRSLQMVLKQEQAAYLPEISAGAVLSGHILSPYTFGQHYLQAVADWDLGKALKKTAEIQQKQLEHQQVVTRQDRLEITGLIAGLYLDVLQNQLEVRILQSRMDYLNKHIEILNMMWEAGTIQQLDILQTRSSVNKLQEELLQKELSGKQARYAMTRLIGLDSPDEFLVDTIRMAYPSADTVGKVPEDWSRNHPESSMIQKEYEKELLRKREVEASYLPHLQMIGGYTFDADPTGDGNYVLLELGATIPVYSWKRKEYQLNEIDFAAGALQAQKKEVERDLYIRYDQGLAQVRQMKQIIDFQQVKLQNDKQAARVAEFNYRSGLATNLDFLTAQQKLTETRLNINTLRNQYLKSIIALWLLTGQVEKVETIK